LQGYTILRDNLTQTYRFQETRPAPPRQGDFGMESTCSVFTASALLNTAALLQSAWISCRRHP